MKFNFNRFSALRDLSAFLISMLVLSFPCNADAAQKLYYSIGSGVTYNVSRANTDGSTVEIAIPDDGIFSPQSMAVDSVNNYVYYVDPVPASPSGIFRAPLGGALPLTKSLVLAVTGIKGVALDVSHGKIYYSVQNDGGLYYIKRANLDGTNVETVLADDGIISPAFLRVDSTNNTLYFIDLASAPKGIYKASLASLPITPAALIGLPSVNSTINDLSLDVPNGKIYYSVSDFTNNLYYLSRANLDGSAIQTVVNDDLQMSMYALEVDSATSSLYFADRNLVSANSGIRKISLVSIPATTSLIIPQTATVQSIAIHNAAAAPTVTTSAASGIGLNGATLNGTVNDNWSSTTVSFDYGLTTGYGTNVAATTGGTVAAGSGSTAVAVTLAALNCGTTYHFRVKAVNGVGTTYGADQGFTTSACPVTYNVTYNANGSTSGTVPTDATNYVSGTTVTVAANSGTLARTGYTFGGWNTQADGLGTNYAAGSGTFTITANVTLFAQWTALPSYTVTFDANGGAGTMANQTTNVATALKSTSFARVGYSFEGWSAVAGGGGTAYADGASYPFTANVTLYAQWTALPSYTVTFD
jgi:uncharacterized repeat protein (TIGR02543 family)